MIRSLAIALVLGTTALVAAQSRPVTLGDVSCESPEKLEKYERCADDCKKASEKRQRLCNRAYQQCRARCSKGGGATCRQTCRTRYRTCSKEQRGELKSCRAECLDKHDCTPAD